MTYNNYNSQNKKLYIKIIYNNQIQYNNKMINYKNIKYSYNKKKLIILKRYIKIYNKIYIKMMIKIYIQIMIKIIHTNKKIYIKIKINKKTKFKCKINFKTNFNIKIKFNNIKIKFNNKIKNHKIIIIKYKYKK